MGVRPWLPESTMQLVHENTQWQQHRRREFSSLLFVRVSYSPKALLIILKGQPFGKIRVYGSRQTCVI